VETHGVVEGFDVVKDHEAGLGACGGECFWLGWGDVGTFARTFWRLESSRPLAHLLAQAGTWSGIG